MPTLTIPNLPRALHERLKARAAAEGRTPGDEARRVLEDALATPEASGVTERLNALRQTTSFRAETGEIEAAIRERRDRA